jgi:hypothetical protein
LAPATSTQAWHRRALRETHADAQLLATPRSVPVSNRERVRQVTERRMTASDIHEISIAMTSSTSACPKTRACVAARSANVEPMKRKPIQKNGSKNAVQYDPLVPLKARNFKFSGHGCHGIGCPHPK